MSSNFLAYDCTTTLPRKPQEKKRHNQYGVPLENRKVLQPRLVEEYYLDMPATNIVNRHAQFLVGIKAAVRTQNVFKRMVCTIIGIWVGNAYGMAMKCFPEERKKRLLVSKSV